MGPYELASLYVILPFIAIFVWVLQKTGAPMTADREFEAWCSKTHPIVFALRIDTDAAEATLAEVHRSLGSAVALAHHRGRDPWTRYLFWLSVERSNGAIVGRVERCTLRRGDAAYPELGATLEAVTARVGSRANELWIHADLHEDDDEIPGRRERGWLASLVQGRPGAFAATNGPPPWIRPRRDR